MLLCVLSDHLRQLPQGWQQVMDQEVLRDVWSRSQGVHTTDNCTATTGSIRALRECVTEEGGGYSSRPPPCRHPPEPAQCPPVEFRCAQVRLGQWQCGDGE